MKKDKTYIITHKEELTYINSTDDGKFNIFQKTYNKDLIVLKKENIKEIKEIKNV